MDSKLLDLLKKRMMISDAIGSLKRDRNVAVFQQERWNSILEKMLSEGDHLGFTDEFIRTIYTAIHQESIYRQDQVINNKSKKE